MRRHAGFAAALLAQLVGSGGALLLSSLTWQDVSADRPRPFGAVSAGMTGRDVDAASTAFALVALAGVVAVLATRGLWRRVTGAVVAVAGAGLVWRGLGATGAVSGSRALDFLESRRRTFSAPAGTRPHIDVHAQWAVLSAVCGVLVVVAGVLVAWRGARWRALSARYERTAAASSAPEPGSPRAAAALWSALDRGEDPTEPTDPRP